MTLPEAIACQFFNAGCPSKISAQTLAVVLLTKEIPVGSPPHSSNTAKRFPLGLSHERGTWYLRLIASSRLHKLDKQSKLDSPKASLPSL
jgi:hypothetical protein